MDFGFVLRRAWEIIWKFKVLWIFGILAGCGQAGNSISNNSGYRFSADDSQFTRQIEIFFNQLDPGVITLLVVLAIIIVLVLIVLAILLGTVGRVGLVRGVVKAEGGAQHLTFGELWRESLPYFWRVFGLNLLVGLIMVVAALVLLIPGILLTAATMGIAALCLIPLICLLVPIAWAVMLVVEQANIALVVENLGIMDAITRGWQVVRENIGSMIVMWLILVLGVGLIGGIIIGLPIVIVAAPMLVGYASGTYDAIRSGWITSGILFLIYLPILLILSGIMKAYISSAWTLTFLRLTAKPSQLVPVEPLITPPPEPVDAQAPIEQDI